MQWVGEFAARLRGDGVDVSLDQWIVGLGKPLPEFMEKLVRENERVLVICTPTYKEKILRAGSWIESIPSWLSGRSGVDFRGEEYAGSEYRRLIDELHRHMPQAPPLGPPPVMNTMGGSRRARDITTPQPQETSEPIKIVDVIEGEVTSPRNDETRGNALYAVPFRLPRHPSSNGAKRFIENWNHLPSFTTRACLTAHEGSHIINEAMTAIAR